MTPPKNRYYTNIKFPYEVAQVDFFNSREYRHSLRDKLQHTYYGDAVRIPIHGAPLWLTLSVFEWLRMCTPEIVSEYDKKTDVVIHSVIETTRDDLRPRNVIYVPDIVSLSDPNTVLQAKERVREHTFDLSTISQHGLAEPHDVVDYIKQSLVVTHVLHLHGSARIGCGLIAYALWQQVADSITIISGDYHLSLYA